MTKLASGPVSLIIMLLACKPLFAQPSTSHNPAQYRAVHWTINEGLSNPDDYCIIKDNQGFIWIGSSNGLNRFDGNTFTYYFSDKSQRTRISDNNIMSLAEDSLHNIWIGTGEGIDRYDIRADTFSNFQLTGGAYPAAHAGLPFWATKNKMLCWDYNSYSIVSYDIRTLNKQTVLKLSNADGLGFRNTKFTYTIYDEEHNTIWMLPERDKGELLEISLTNGKRTYYAWPDNRKPRKEFHYTLAEAMKFDKKRNCIWINSPEGLISFSIKDKQFQQIPALDSLTSNPAYDRLVGLDFDTRGRIWFATQPGGLVIYDPEQKSVSYPFPGDSALSVDAGFANACIYADRDGMVWTGSWLKTGVYQIAPFYRSVTHYMHIDKDPLSLRDNDVVKFIPADKGKIWIKTLSGAMNIFDPVTQKFTVFEKKELKGLADADYNGLSPVLIDTIAQKAWLTRGTLYQMDLNTKKCERIIFKDRSGHEFTPDPKQDVYSVCMKDVIISRAGHENKQGLFITDRKNNIATEVFSFAADSIEPYLTAVNDSLLFIVRQPAELGRLCFSYSNHVLKAISTPIDKLLWSDIVYNKTDQTYWLFAERQLIHYDKNLGVIRRFTTKDGLPALDMSCPTIDNSGNIWFHTDRSVHQFNTGTNIFSQLSLKDGFDKMDFLNFPETMKDSYGDIYFPTGYLAQGFVRISPRRYVSPPATVVIKSIDVNQHLLSSTIGANSTEELSLKYSENKINISTGIIDFYSRGKGSIRYKLEGQDSDWQYSSYYSTIRYEGLPTGKKFRLMMQASNSSNEFNGPIKNLLLYLSPAIWETWWFRTLAVLFLGAIFYLIIRWRLQQNFKLQLERSEKERQIVDMKQKASELEMQALRAQMNPHFIFNSLNSINRFILQNNKAQASEYLTKFSKLVRLILQNSQAPLITLESELESLELYLNLEALRFNYHFDYKISVPPDMDIEVLKVPPLILQPYVENAIWHGLMHKEEKGNLNVSVKEEHEHLYFTITDNGVGRKQSAAMASKSATKHKSMGLRITAHRIAMLQHNEGLESPVRIIDLMNDDSTGAGTEVIIKMPVIYD